MFYATFPVKAVQTVCALALVLATAGAVQAEYLPDQERMLSPYFVVSGGKEGEESLPLKRTSAEVNIVGVIADVEITQVYQNQGNTALEASYVFPASTQAAVHGLRMTIGERVIRAQIKEREQAKQIYQVAKKEGKSASLLEQERPNVFQMRVANIMPGDEIHVVLSYSEIIKPTGGVYEFVYPTVVGPRYSNRKADQVEAKERWVANPYTEQGQQPGYAFDLRLNLTSGIELKDVLSPSHKINTNFSGNNSATVALDSSEANGGNRDFILRYRLAGQGIDAGSMFYQDQDENYFLLMLEPPQRVDLQLIPPREYIFIIDVSGSMHGFPLDISKQLLTTLLQTLRGKDSFNVILFASGQALLADQSLPATPENIESAVQFISSQHGGGGTELLPALRQALALTSSEGTSRTVVIATDGYIDVEREAFEIIRDNLGNANFFSFGIGSSVNRYLIEGLARVGFGESFVATNQLEAQVMARSFQQYISTPVLTQVQVTFEGFEAYDVQPVQQPDLFAERPLTLIGKWRGEAKGAIEVSGLQAGKPFVRRLAIDAKSLKGNKRVLRQLWARTKIAELADFIKFENSSELAAQITQLGLKYSILTEFTSFVAVDEVVRNPGRDNLTVKQPLPLPQGVSNLAVGSEIGTSPEPETYLLLLVVLSALSIVFIRKRALLWGVSTHR